MAPDISLQICDGEAQGHDGINYSLPSRDMIANMIEIHANATPFDGGVFVASCDKGMPAHLMGIGRVNIPSIVITGGVMDAGPDLLTLEQIGMYSAMCERGEITEEKLTYYKQHAVLPVAPAPLWEPLPPCRLWQKPLALCFQEAP